MLMTLVYTQFVSVLTEQFMRPSFDALTGIESSHLGHPAGT